MNKDALLATIIGFGVGLLITGVLVFGPTIGKYLPSIKFPTLSLSSPLADSSKDNPDALGTSSNEAFTIDSPQHESVETNDSLLVSGKAPSGSMVVVEGVQNEQIVEANEQNTYAADIDLIEGENRVTATYYDQEGKGTEKTITVYYTEETL